VPDGIDAAIAAVEPAGLDPVLDRMGPIPDFTELPVGDDEVLPIGKNRNRAITWTILMPYMATAIVHPPAG
jgi:hypothetical protein